MLVSWLFAGRAGHGGARGSRQTSAALIYELGARGGVVVEEARRDGLSRGGALEDSFGAKGRDGGAVVKAFSEVRRRFTCSSWTREADFDRRFSRR